MMKDGESEKNTTHVSSCHCLFHYRKQFDQTSNPVFLRPPGLPDAASPPTAVSKYVPYLRLVSASAVYLIKSNVASFNSQLITTTTSHSSDILAQSSPFTHSNPHLSIYPIPTHPLRKSPANCCPSLGLFLLRFLTTPDPKIPGSRRICCTPSLRCSDLFLVTECDRKFIGVSVSP